MWTTKYTYDERGVVQIVFYFGNEVTVIADRETNRFHRYHGKVCVSDWSADVPYFEALKVIQNIDAEINGGKEATNV